MPVKKIIFALLVLLFALPAASQGTGPKEKSIKEELKSNKQLRHEKREKRRQERAERRAVKKYHKRLQTKTVRKRMKSSRKEAVRHNDNKREPFFKRWFRRKHKAR